MGRKFGFSFSTKRALGISGAKHKLARATGIPTTRSGRQRKLGRVTSGGGCFVATACYGDATHPDVATFRRFRDHVLRLHAPGRRIIAWYYRWAPRVAGDLESRGSLRSACRICLQVLAVLMRTAGIGGTAGHETTPRQR